MRGKAAATHQAPEQQSADNASLVPDSDTDDIPLAQRKRGCPSGGKEEGSNAAAARSKDSQSRAGMEAPAAGKQPQWPSAGMDAAEPGNEDAAGQEDGTQYVQHLNAQGFWTVINGNSVAARRKRKQADPRKAEVAKLLPSLPRSGRPGPRRLRKALKHIRSAAVSLRPLQLEHLAQLPRCLDLNISFTVDVSGACMQRACCNALCGVCRSGLLGERMECCLCAH